MALYLTEADVESLVTVTDAIAALEESFRHQGAGAATNEPRRRVRTPNCTLHVMFGADRTDGVLGLKAYTVAGGKARFHVQVRERNMRRVDANRVYANGPCGGRRDADAEHAETGEERI